MRDQQNNKISSVLFYVFPLGFQHRRERAALKNASIWRFWKKKQF